jgi:transcriptional regulator with XRE-family HTH domain
MSMQATKIAHATDPEILARMGQRLRAWRIERELTIQELAARASLTPLTVLKAERGENFTFRTFLRILRVLGALDQLDLLLPPPPPSPLGLLDRKPAPALRQRVRRTLRG